MTTTATVGELAEEFRRWHRLHRRSQHTTESALRAHILPAFRDHLAEQLTAPQVEQWHQGMAAARGTRAAKVTANRNLVILRMLLGRAVRLGQLRNTAWQAVQGFRGVERRRTRWLKASEIPKLLDALAPDFRQLVEMALLTGARYGELAQLRAQDVLPDLQVLQVTETKTTVPRTVHLGHQAAVLVHRLAEGREPESHLLTHADGRPWGRCHQIGRMHRGCRAAAIAPITFHGLRHTYASHYLMGGGSPYGLMRQLGHRDLRTTVDTYVHALESWRSRDAVLAEPPLAGDADPAIH